MEQSDNQKAKSDKKKLSFKEQKELDTLNEEIIQLERRKSEIETLLSNPSTDVKEIERLTIEFSTIMSDIDEKTLRWIELQE